MPGEGASLLHRPLPKQSEIVLPPAGFHGLIARPAALSSRHAHARRHLFRNPPRARRDAPGAEPADRDVHPPRLRLAGAVRRADGADRYQPSPFDHRRFRRRPLFPHQRDLRPCARGACGDGDRAAAARAQRDRPARMANRSRASATKWGRNSRPTPTISSRAGAISRNTVRSPASAPGPSWSISTRSRLAARRASR